MGALVVESNSEAAGNYITILQPPSLPYIGDSRGYLYTPIKVLINPASYPISSNADGSSSAVVSCTYPQGTGSIINAKLTFYLASNQGTHLGPPLLRIDFTRFLWSQNGLSLSLGDLDKITSMAYHFKYHFTSSTDTVSDIATNVSDMTFTVENNGQSTIHAHSDNGFGSKPNNYSALTHDYYLQLIPGTYQLLDSGGGTYTTINLNGINTKGGPNIGVNLTFRTVYGTTSPIIDQGVGIYLSVQTPTDIATFDYTLSYHLNNPNPGSTLIISGRSSTQ